MIKSARLAYTFPAICILGSVAVLLTSFLVEHKLDIEPCRLCKLQRLPYLALIPLSAFLYAPKFKQATLIAIATGLIVSIALASYHLLIISGFVQDPCSVPNNIQTMNDFHMLLEAPLPCSVVKWKLLGLPISAYNLILATTSLTGISYLYVKRKIL